MKKIIVGPLLVCLPKEPPLISPSLLSTRGGIPLEPTLTHAPGGIRAVAREIPDRQATNIMDLWAMVTEALFVVIALPPPE